MIDIFDRGTIKLDQPKKKKASSVDILDRGTIQLPKKVEKKSTYAGRLLGDELPKPSKPTYPSIVDGEELVVKKPEQFQGTFKKPVSELFGKPSEEVNYLDVIGELLTGNRRETKATESLPEFGTTGGAGVDVSPALTVAKGLMATMDSKAQMNIIKNTIPGSMFQEDEHGNIIIAIPQEGGGFSKSILNKPGASLADGRTLAAQMLAFVPAAKLAALGKNIFSMMGLAAGGAAATDASLQGIAKAAGSEKDFDVTQAALAGVLGPIAEVAGPSKRAVQRVFTGTKAAPVDALPASSKLVDVAEEASIKTGVDLFPAQKTLVPSELKTQALVAQYPGGAQQAMKALEKQNAQAYNVTNEFLEKIAPPEVMSTGAKRFKSAAEKSIEKVKQIRREAASPIYKQAARRQRELKQPPVDTKALETKAMEIAKQFSLKGEVGKNLAIYSRRMKEAEGSISKLHFLKMSIDQKIAKVGEGAVGNTTKKFLREIQKDLTDELTKQSPSYRAAREEFIRTSPAVSDLAEGVIGKTVKIKDVDLKRLSSNIFDAAETNPSVVQNVRKTIDKIDPQAYDDLLRVELERRIGSMKPTQEGLQNIPGQLNRAIFGSGKQRRILLTALRPAQRKEALYIETVLKRASVGRHEGSSTISNAAAKERIEGTGVPGVVRRLLKTDVTKPGQILAETGEEAARQRNARIISELVYNPEYTKTIKGIRELEKTNRRQANIQMQNLITTVKGEFSALSGQSKGLPEIKD